MRGKLKSSEIFAQVQLANIEYPEQQDIQNTD
jgi:hypothetical protein